MKNGFVPVIKIWLQAVRVFSLTASLIPVLLGAALSAGSNNPVSWWLLPPVLLAAMLFQAGTNMVSDYYDLRKGVDKSDSYGGSKVILQGKMSPQTMLAGGLVMFAAGCMLGILFLWLRGPTIMIIGLIGLLGGLLYSAGPVGYKYLALGDIAVFVLMGPLMVIGSYYVLTGDYNNGVLLNSLPVGCLVTAILAANNLRDIKHDSLAHVKTFASLVGPETAKVEYFTLVAGAYVIAIVNIAAGVLTPWSLLVLVTVPIAIKNVRRIAAAQVDEPERIAGLDVESAKLHLAFGILLVIAVVLGAII